VRYEVGIMSARNQQNEVRYEVGIMSARKIIDGLILSKSQIYNHSKIPYTPELSDEFESINQSINQSIIS
jgi:hypothetical protein